MVRKPSRSSRIFAKWHKTSNIFKRFWDDLRSIHYLRGEALYTAKRPIFDNFFEQTDFDKANETVIDGITDALQNEALFMADTNDEEQLAASNASQDSSSPETPDTPQPVDMDHPHPNVTVRRKGRYTKTAADDQSCKEAA